MAQITMYCKTTCPYCIKAEKLLRDKGVTDIEKIKIETNPEAKAEMVSRSGGRTTVPQIFINGEHIGGCDDLIKLNAEGELDAKLAAESAGAGEAADVGSSSSKEDGSGNCTGGEGGCCGSCGGKGSEN